MSIVLLTNDSDRGQALAHLILRDGLDLKLVVVEKPSLANTDDNKTMFLLRKYLGPIYRKLKELFTLKLKERQALKYEEESIRKAEEQVQSYLSGLKFSGRPEGVEYLETPSLREATVVTAVTRAQPDLCVVLGTSIIKPRLISIPRIGTINAHTSVLPEYRGSRSEFWQCYNQAFGNVGVTLHFIDNGVDTGGILFQKKQEVGPNPDPNFLRAMNTQTILENYVPTIRAVLEGNLDAKDQGQCTTPTYRFRDITEEKRIKLYSRIMDTAKS